MRYTAIKLQIWDILLHLAKQSIELSRHLVFIITPQKYNLLIKLFWHLFFYSIFVSLPTLINDLKACVEFFLNMKRLINKSKAQNYFFMIINIFGSVEH